jgi:hypothetical protein
MRQPTPATTKMRISYDRGVVSTVYDTKVWPLKKQIVFRCRNMMQGCKVLDERLQVIATCTWKGDFQHVGKG